MIPHSKCMSVAGSFFFCNLTLQSIHTGRAFSASLKLQSAVASTSNIYESPTGSPQNGWERDHKSGIERWWQKGSCQMRMIDRSNPTSMCHLTYRSPLQDPRAHSLLIPNTREFRYERRVDSERTIAVISSSMRLRACWTIASGLVAPMLLRVRKPWILDSSVAIPVNPKHQINAGNIKF